MGRKPKGEKAMTAAERQKLYRQRRKPANKEQEFRLKLLQLASMYGHFLDVDVIAANLEVFADHYGMEQYVNRFADRDSEYLDNFYNGVNVFFGHQPISELIAEMKEKNKEYQAEKDAKKTKKEPLDPVDAGKIIAGLA